jgi:hypothetical protein
MVDLSIKLWVALTEPETLVDFKKLHSISISENSPLLLMNCKTRDF